MSREDWTPIPGYEGVYEITSDGQVRSLTRTVPDARWGEHLVWGRTMTQTVDHNGHHRVALRAPGAKKNRLLSVHGLVLETFVGPRPEGLVCCHNNGDPSDNRVENLRWDTQSSNIRDAVKHGTHNQTRKSRCSRGHAFDEENTRYSVVGSRRCLACERIRSASRDWGTAS